MNGFMDIWSKRAVAGEETVGTLFDPSATASGPDGRRRDPKRRRKTVLATAIVTAVGIAGIASAAWWRGRAAR